MHGGSCRRTQAPRCKVDDGQPAQGNGLLQQIYRNTQLLGVAIELSRAQRLGQSDLSVDTTSVADSLHNIAWGGGGGGGGGVHVHVCVCLCMHAGGWVMQ